MSGGVWESGEGMNNSSQPHRQDGTNFRSPWESGQPGLLHPQGLFGHQYHVWPFPDTRKQAGLRQVLPSPLTQCSVTSTPLHAPLSPGGQALSLLASSSPLPLNVST